MKYSVDRIENGIAVCEDDEMNIIRLPVSSLPQGTKEGSVLIKEADGWQLDAESERERRENIMRLQKKLFSEK